MSEKVKAVIFDVDGTLADVSGVRHYVLDDPRRKDFTKFHGAASYVRPMPLVVELAQALSDQGFFIIVVTSRNEQWRFRTSTWLRKWRVPADRLYMRRDGDHRGDGIVKREILNYLREHYDIVLAFDDNPTVIQVWREEGIPVVRVPGWIEEDEMIKKMEALTS